MRERKKEDIWFETSGFKNLYGVLEHILNS